MGASMTMRFAILAALASSGCFYSWGVTQLAGKADGWNESVREEAVPQPDTRERLMVTMPLTLAPAASVTDPFAFRCQSSQTASNKVYRNAVRYGGTWKKLTAAAFLIEAGIAAATYAFADRSKPAAQLAIGFFGLDALGTAAIFFLPRKEIFDSRTERVTDPFRADCPAGLVLEIGGDTFPVDAAGQIGNVGEAALEAWMLNPSLPIRLTYHDRVIDLPIGQNQVCTWLQVRGLDQSRCPTYWAAAPTVAATLDVPVGTLTRAE
jgi:hypothetical protein